MVFVLWIVDLPVRGTEIQNDLCGHLDDITLLYVFSFK